MRDKIKDENYFKTLLQNENEGIISFENAVQKVILERGEADRGVRNGYNILAGSYQKKINLLYSCGENIEEIQKCFQKLVFYYGKMWDREYGYIDLIKVLSLGVLLGSEKEAIAEIEEKIISEKFNDYLVNKLIKEIDPSWGMDGEAFEVNGIYNSLKTIVEGGKEFACDELKKYLKEEWYEVHRECYWYDSHKSSKSIYYGYWSFEAGAIAKILQLDDSSLKDVPYYPYDLVHYGD